MYHFTTMPCGLFWCEEKAGIYLDEEGYIDSHHEQLKTGYWTTLGSRISE